MFAAPVVDVYFNVAMWLLTQSSITSNVQYGVAGCAHVLGTRYRGTTWSTLCLQRPWTTRRSDCRLWRRTSYTALFTMCAGSHVLLVQRASNTLTGTWTKCCTRPRGTTGNYANAVDWVRGAVPGGGDVRMTMLVAECLRECGERLLRWTTYPSSCFSYCFGFSYSDDYAHT